MRLMNAVGMLSGAVVIYVAMASCAASDRPTGRATGSGGGGTHGGDGATNASGGHGGSAGTLMDPVPPAQAESGSRLKARFTLGDDGSKSYHDGVFWDSERQEDCSFLPMGDGKLHCIPEGYKSNNLFLDDACTIRVTHAPCDTGSKYALQQEPQVCNGGWSVYPLGPIQAAADVFETFKGGCYHIAAATGDIYWTLGTEIPASAFVASAEGHE